MFKVKTRNWNGKKWVAKLLNKTNSYGVSVYESPDNDNKYFIETKSHIKAWSVFACFMLLSHFSGGWTYIILPGHELRQGYKSIN